MRKSVSFLVAPVVLGLLGLLVIHSRQSPVRSEAPSLSVSDSQLMAVIESGGSDHSKWSAQQATSTIIVATYGPVVGPTILASPTAPVATVTPQPQITLTPTNSIPTTPTIPPTATNTPLPPLPTLHGDMMGVQAYANVEEQRWWYVVDRAQFMGVRWLKFQVSWKEIEPTKGQFSPQFTALKTNLIYAGRRGFKMAISIANAPDWARPAQARGQADGPPANPQDLADFVGMLLDQFGTQYLNAVEIWNEPNVVNQWTGVPLTAASYKTYFDAAYKAIRARTASITVLTAGPAPAGNTNGSVDDRQWLQALYTAGLPVADPNFAIGIHPYGWANLPDAHCCASPSKGWDNQPAFFFLDTINDYRAIMVKNNHAQGKLWATEFGWATFKGLHFKDHLKGPPAIPQSDPGLGWLNILNEDQQAQYTVRAYELAQTGNLAAFMGPMFLWNMNFATLPGYIDDQKPALPEAAWSVLDSDLNPRPIYYLLQAAPKK